MKVFKIIKYHIPYNHSISALCGKSRDMFIRRRMMNGFGEYITEFAYTGQHKLVEYKENMDICETCKQMNFRRMVRKLKGKGSF